MTFPDPGHVNGFYLSQFLGTAGWAKRDRHANHPLEGLDPDAASDLDFLASLLFPVLDGLNEAQDAALARTWAYALEEFDDRDLGWFLLGQLPIAPASPRLFLGELAKRLYPTGLPPADAQARRLDQPHDSLFDLRLAEN
ncbi:hypothetical protein [Deinococcus sp.]|uniref:hypothetical protein n=1 Tax=Deinococcus sp. TaxID=47478 RepID=UPI003C7A0EAB